MTGARGTFVDIPTPDGTADAYLTHPDDDTPHPAVLLYMDIFGPRPHLWKMADRLAEAGYTALIPNVFYRHGRAPLVELPDFIGHDTRPEVFQELMSFLPSLTPEAAMRDADAYLRWLADCPQATDGPVGVTGYCMGARLALRTAGAFPERVAAMAGFHGGDLATEAPDSPHLVADRITADAARADGPPRRGAHGRGRTPPQRGLSGRAARLHPGRHRRVQRGRGQAPLGSAAGPLRPHALTVSSGVPRSTPPDRCRFEWVR